MLGQYYLKCQLISCWMLALVACFFCVGLVSAEEPGQDTIINPTAQVNQSDLIRVAMVDYSVGTANGPKDVRQILTLEAGFDYHCIGPDDVIRGQLAEEHFDLVIMPGGSGSAQSRALGEEGANNVKQFVDNGGGYMGICAGAYLGSANYPWSLHLVNAKILDTKHWARGTGQVTVDFTPAGQQLLEHPDQQGEIYYGQGPLLAPGDSEDLPAYEVLASYATEIAKKGAPTGVMIGTTAIARAPYGKGRVILFSPHPEKKNGLHYLIRNGAYWAGSKVQETATSRNSMEE